jgi:hypothetical protein
MLHRPHLFALATIVVVLGLAQPALASGVAGSFSASIGAAFPSSSRATQLGGSTQLSLGIDYRFPGWASTLRPLGAYFDYRTGSSGGSHLSGYGLGVSLSNEPLSRSLIPQPYVGLGLGYYTSTASFHVPSLGTVSQSQTNVGGKVFGGIDFVGGLGVQASYEVSPNIRGVNTDAFGVRFRYRFF